MTHIFTNVHVLPICLIGDLFIVVSTPSLSVRLIKVLSPLSICMQVTAPRQSVRPSLSRLFIKYIYICILFFNPSILSGCQPISLSAPADTSVFWHKIPKGFLFLFRPLYLCCCLLVCLAAAAPSSLFSLSVSVYKFSKDWKKEALLTFTWSSKWSCISQINR